MAAISRAMRIRIQAAVGATAAAFGVAAYYKTTREEAKIKALFKQRTTVKDLEDMADRGEPLPPLAIICGTLHADAPLKGKEGTAISQILLTRLSPFAKWSDKGKADKDGVVEKELIRSPKTKRYTVATMRLVAPGLYLKGPKGGEATITLPEVDEDMGKLSPSLFLTEADAVQEFFTSQELKGEVEVDLGERHSMTGSRFQHLSKFITVDRDTEADNPREFFDSFKDLLKEWELNGDAVTIPRPCRAGFLSGTKYLWLPEGFYDDPLKHKFSFPNTEFVGAEEFVRRGHIAARENNMHSPYQFEALDLGAKRDSEFGYRLVHLDIPVEQPVTVVARPVLAPPVPGQPRRIELIRPPGEEMGIHWRFRILKDHAVDNLLQHPSTRPQNKLAFQIVSGVGAFLAGLAAAGVAIL